MRIDSAKPASEVVISLDAVGKSFGRNGEIRALEGVSCQIHDREFVAVLGPSGCGKSTMLRIIGGLIPYNDGTVTVLGHPAKEPKDDVGIVFQSTNLLSWRTVEGNMRLGVELQKLPDPDFTTYKVD